MKILIATNNNNKLNEFKNKLKDFNIEFICLNDLSDYTEVNEDQESFHGNSYVKAKYFYDKYKIPVLSDDSGLVCYYNNLPGVWSKRFASNDGDDYLNNQKLLELLTNVNDRKAYFITVLCFIINDEVHYFEGRLEGEIAYDLVGDNGFGYDPLFIVGDKRLAELNIEEKNRISHRANAINCWIDFLKKMEENNGK